MISMRKQSINYNVKGVKGVQKICIAPNQQLMLLLGVFKGYSALNILSFVDHFQSLFNST